MLVNWNNSFNRPSYNQYYSGYSQAFQKDNYKCKTIPSNKPDGKLEGNQGFLNAGNKTLHDWGFSALYTQIPGLILPCERDFPKVENCMVYRCNQSGYCFMSGPFGLTKLPWYLDPFWDIFIEEPFFNYYNPPNCNPIEGAPCELTCKSEKPRITSQDVFNAIYEASQQLTGTRCKRALSITFTIKGDIFTGSGWKGDLVEKRGLNPPEDIRPADPGDIGCTEDCTPEFTALGGIFYLNDPDLCNAVEVALTGRSCSAEQGITRIYLLDRPEEGKTVYGYHVPISLMGSIYPWDGTFYTNIPEKAKDACSVVVSIITVVCEGEPSQYDPTVIVDRERKRRPPPIYERRRERPKEDPPECMQCCTCEDVERIIAKYVNKSIYGHGILDSCNSRIVEWSGDGLQGISKGLEAVVSAINDLGRALCPEVRGNFSLPDCKTGTSNFDYHGKGIQGLSKQLEALAKGLRHTTGELCEARGDIMREVISIPNKVQIQLSDDFALVVGKLNQILSRLGKDDDNIFSKVVQIITLIATLLGLLNDIRTLFDRQKDYTADLESIKNMLKDHTPDLESIKNMLKELERLLTPTLQGSIDAIRCDGTINSNSWGGEGLEGLNQAITALGVNMAILHSDICELLGKKLDEMKPPLLQGSVDAIRCDGSISSNSWEGEGFEGLNQAVTAIGVNLAILHSDLCELLERQTDEIKPPRLQGSVDAIRCDGTISRNSWDGEGFEGLNQAITAIGVNLAILHADLCELLDRRDEEELPLLQGSIDAIRCDGTIRSNSWSGKGFDGVNQAITAIGTNLAILHGDLCELLKDEKDTFQVTDKYKCGENEVSVPEKIENTAISRELKFLYERLKRIELLICELEECNAVPVFPGDSIEERNIPAQAVITFVEQKYYPKMSGSKWHVSIPYPKEDLISEQNCWSKFENLIIKKGNVHGTVVWKSPNNTINRFYAGLFGHDENGLREFLERIAGFSRLQKATIRITTGGNPRARPKDVTIQAVKVVVLERDDQGRMVPVKCCRAPKKAGR